MTEQQALPTPPLPASVDLREFPYMPLEVARLRDSETSVRTKGDEFRCAVLLWCVSWHQVPAASLPDDDVLLADFAGFGRAVREWKRVKAGALRGFTRCADGRLYHGVVAAIAITSWGSLLKGRHYRECVRIKKYNQRHPNEKLSMPTFELWISQTCPEAIPYLSRWTRVHVPGDASDVSPGQQGRVPGEKPSNRIELKGLPVSTTVPSTTSTDAAAVDNPGPEARTATPRATTGHQRKSDPMAEGQRRGIPPRVGESMEAYEQRLRNTRAA